MAQHHLLNSIDMLLDPIRIGATNNAWVNVSEVIREYMTVTGNEWSNIGGKLTVPAAVFAFTVAATAAEAGTNYAATYGLRYLPLNNESIDLPPKQDQFGEDFWLLGAETDSDLAKVATATINSAGNTKVVSDAGVGASLIVAGDIVHITGWTDLNGQYGVASITNDGANDIIELITAGYGDGFITSTSPAAGAAIHKCDKCEFLRGKV